MKNATSFLSTGLPPLNHLLGGGWASGALTELLSPPGGGKTQLALPAISELTQKKKWVAVVSQGPVFFPPAFAGQGVDLQQILWLSPKELDRVRWSAEQIVKSGLFPLVVIHEVKLKEEAVRRLQLSAERSLSTVLLLQNRLPLFGAWAISLRMEVSRQSKEKVALKIVKTRKLLSQLFLEVSFNERTNSSDSLSELPGQKLAM